MRFITLEEHISSPQIKELCREYIDPSLSMRKLPEALVPGYDKLREDARLADLDYRLAYMEKNGVDVQVLSYANSMPTELPADKAVEFYRMCNDEIRKLMDLYPGKFEGFAILPLQSPEAAAEELERCVVELGFKGAMMDSCFNGHFYDEPCFLPVFAKAAELDVPLSLHPSFVDEKVTDYYYRSPNWGDGVTGALASAGFGWHLDVGMQLLKLVLSGIFDKYPNLKLITGHWGEVVVYYIERLNQIMSCDKTGLKKPLIDYYRENIYYTPGGMLSEAQMEYVIKMFGVDHILFALDYPYVAVEDGIRFIEESKLSDEDKEKIAHGNAERLLKIK